MTSLKNRLSYFYQLAAVAVLALGMTACSEEETTDAAKLSIRLTDAPADYDAVNVDIQEVRIHTSPTADEDDGGWVTLDMIAPGVYNLLDFTNGKDTLLATADLPAGKISQIRLILGENNTLVEDGQIKVLRTPSAQQSGLKLQINETFEPGVAYTILLDFDASRSVVKAGNSGNYNLKPVIRTIVSAASGAIAGSVVPSNEKALVQAIKGTDTLGTYTATDGKFLLKGVPAGLWKVEISNDLEQDKTLENVQVTLGNTTNVGAVTLQ